jgi:hypothetical protein
MGCLVASLAGEAAGPRFYFEAILVAWVLRELGKAVFRKSREGRCLWHGVQKSAYRKGLYPRRSGRTKTGLPESEERMPGNPLDGSPLQQLHDRHVGKLDCSDFSVVELQGDRVASRQIQQQSSDTTNMPRFELS